MSNEEALAILSAHKSTPMRDMTEVQCRLWWMAKGVLRDSLDNGQIEEDQLPSGVIV